MKWPSITLPRLLLTVTAVGISAKAAVTLPEVTSESFVAEIGVTGNAYAMATEEDPSPDGAAEDGVDESEQETQCEVPEDLLLAIEEERAIVENQRKAAEEKMAEAELAMDKVEIETAKLEELKSEITGLLDKIEAAKTRDLERLVSVYTGMKPGEAAAIMNDLDLEVTVMVLGQMSERSAAPIIARMTPVRAQAISKIIYERSQLPGDQDLNGIRLE
ncbi:MotE family protein [Salipiger mucosus]|uniref:Flagellar protein FlbB n=1 Tax=Salipiger mucosus DSM 16094 TaxID=1123237 RepID=S9Q9F7_9RHOB|nr:hypothetical protein [Salipiger mucosus]EPX78006.1 hypothetical protein Salmuc_03328 [Salipiger mucosus DSM 16094]